MTLAFLKELGIEDSAAEAILERFACACAEAEETAKSQNEQILAQAREKESLLTDQIDAMRKDMLMQRVDRLIEASGLKSAMVREAARKAMLSYEGEAEEYLSSLREQEPELFDDGRIYPYFAAGLETEASDEITPPFHYLRLPRSGRGGGA